ncbi:hypothetical protein H696_02828 [Fonticula alba]|uniref:Ribosomal RNA-processing protein 44 n=1 Tax=Fonticula alba TaxID=691883 RepID=A0A058ZAN2_FONAL|nr:hypothetical protein H696_02828 [Fonticula alba]KCV70487.1 hypothetical protein H696_02828 [Fonticula alba]|eukprot:XP_009495003.1 hypothetical protein H696_02828 [Fonticula alba]
MRSSAFPDYHAIVPDTNVFLHQMDALEHSALHDIVILQTVLSELKHRSPVIYSRARSLVSDASRRCIVFNNENHRETYVLQNPEETPNDRNDRAIRTATRWLDTHWAPLGMHAVMLTQDRQNLQMALNEETAPCHARHFVDYAQALAEEFPDLADRLASLPAGSGAGVSVDPLLTADLTPEERFDFPAYLDEETVTLGVKSGRFLRGNVRISDLNVEEALVWTRAHDLPVVVPGLRALNRAIEGDTVALELLPESEWVLPTSEAKLDSAEATDGQTSRVSAASYLLETDADLTAAPLATAETRPHPTGRVVAIIQRNRRPYCGGIPEGQLMLPALDEHGTRVVLFQPLDRRIPRIRIRTRLPPADLLAKRIVVAIDDWDAGARHPRGHYIRTIGAAGTKDTESEVILLENGVPFGEFSAAAHACLPDGNWSADAAIAAQGGLGRRVDLRDVLVCSVDPPGTTDIDDALHARVLPSGNVEVGVHIADVTHFVKPNTPLDAEAAARSTSVYLVDRRISMLPNLLGTNLCSLLPDVDRFTFSCLWELDPVTLRVVSTRFVKSVVRSRRAFSYEEAQLRLDDPAAYGWHEDDPVTGANGRGDPLVGSLVWLNRIAQRLREQRRQAGALMLSSPEVRFELGDDKNPLYAKVKNTIPANSLVEEFMLFANVSVARFIVDAFPQTSVLRRHPAPTALRFDELQQFLRARGHSLDVSSNRALADSLDRCSDPEDPFFNSLCRMLVTRCLMQAVYFASGTQPRAEFAHYGLARDIYTHFTSPIRRYSDILVHRLLAAAIDFEPTSQLLIHRDNITRLCNVINIRHRSAKKASMSSTELFTGLLFSRFDLAQEETAYVVRVMSNGLVVHVPAFGLEGFIPITSANFRYNRKLSQIEHLDGRKFLGVFDRARVSLMAHRPDSRVDVANSLLKISLLAPSLDGTPCDPVPAPTLESLAVPRIPQRAAELAASRAKRTQPEDAPGQAAREETSSGQIKKARQSV